MDTGWMCQMLLLSEATIDDPVNGLVTDAAHGYCHLCVLCNIGCWVPRLFTVSDGAMRDHYWHNFLGVFELILDITQQKGIEVKDEMFLMVVDFSDAQMLSFKDAFIELMGYFVDVTIISGQELHLLLM
ncbi:hypothetical protein GYMLUDRAFT_63495 [Collybiopsis luxurians FD-317 M1]|uniref:Unplaced genomic scaffold GYMLUscaffold_75, whole genome shotgun sequence n=1 Tax=Collybiopsis luxurians FD-317 M1 TaxID=944289 RepID=A0A0D0CFT7_9AGAR|nr:hypothetical protein GYMLUDRAFT_63495 [Collybiopsis luxurians FD-317 M1]